MPIHEPTGRGEYALIMVDLTDLWCDRIHQIRPRFDFPYADSTEDMSFDLLWMGLFRSADRGTYLRRVQK